MTEPKEMSLEELKALLAQKEKEAKKEAEAKRKAYLKERDELVRNLTHNAQGIHDLMKEFKAKCFDGLTAFYEVMKEYGDVKTNNKGTFSIKSEDGSIKVEFTNQMVKEFDERADMAAKHIDNFLQHMVKKNNLKVYKLVKGLTEKKNDKFDVKLVGRLFQMENEFDDPEWINAIKLFRESYVEQASAQYIRFYVRDEKTGEYHNVNLNFSSI